ncbi:hypothetical protein AX15_002152 [Amanita polypyramis BW_CC]|nr:hypothetical protein AX15_002152 [Amanita polypyramis BW_CC]
MLTLYDILGISQSASGDELRKAYKSKALETHPDRLGPSAPKLQTEIAQARFQKVHEAFNVLGDPQERKTYDASLARSSTDKLYRQTEQKELDEQLKRMKDRTEWARHQQKRDEERIKAMRAKGKELKDAQDKKEREAKMAEEFLRELFVLNPEWEERKRRVYQVRRHRYKGTSPSFN